MSEREAALATLLAATRETFASIPAIGAFTGDQIDGDMPLDAPQPEDLPATRHLDRCRALACAETQPMVDALAAGAPHFRWQQSYTAAQLDARFMEGYAWVNLVSPTGAYIHPGLRIGIGFWVEGLRYPRHWHEPEEMYLVLAGRGVFFNDEEPDRPVGPGDTQHHRPWLPHGAVFTPGPMIALAVWKGGGLTDAPVLDPEDRP